MQAKIFSTILLSFFFFLSACLKDGKELIDKAKKTNGAKWDPEIAIPIVNTTLTLDDIIKNTSNAFVKKDADNVVMIAYQGELFSQSAEEFVNIDNQTFSSEITLSPSQQNYLSSNGSISLFITDYIEYKTDNIEIDSMLLKVCNNQLRVRSTFQHDIEFQITLPEVTKNGIPFSIDMNGVYNGTDIDLNQNANLSGYMFNMSTGPKGTNQVKVEMRMKIIKKNGNAITGNEKVTANIFMFYNEFKELYGYVGQESFMVESDSFKFDALDKLSNGTFSIEDPRFKLIITNSLGVPLRANVLKLQGYSSAKGATNLTGVPSPLPVPVPNLSQKGQVLKDSVVLNKSTSNLAQLINNLPTHFIYGFDVTSNPAGKTVRNFVLDTSKITFGVEVEVPLYGSVNNITLNEITDADFGLSQEVDFLDNVLIRLAISNGFPLGVDLQVYLLDSNEVVLDSVFTNTTQFLPPAPVNFTTGRVTEPAKNIVDITFEKSRIDNLNRTRKVKIAGILNTTKNNGAVAPVKIYGDYGLGVKLGVQAKISFNQKF